MVEWLDLLHKAESDLDSDSDQLRSIAKVLSRVGSLELADELYEIAYGLRKTAEDIRKSTNLKTNSDLKDATGMSATIFSLVLDKSVRESEKSKKKRKSE